MASQGILLLKAEKKKAFHRQRNRATISHSQSTTVLYSFFFQKESSHGSWIPFLFSANVHRPWKILQLSRPISAEQVGHGWPWALLHHSPPPISPPAQPGTCVPHTAQGQLQAPWSQFCLLLSDPPIVGSRCHPPLRAKRDGKLSWKHGDMLTAFPFLKKSDFWVGVRRKQAGVREEEHVGVGPLEEVQTVRSRCSSTVTMLKLERKQEN